jgi:hypothetical protein
VIGDFSNLSVEGISHRNNGQMASIVDLLRDKAIIDYSLISDNLSGVLSELCEIITKQGAAIDTLRAELPGYVLRNDLANSAAEQTGVIAQLKQDLEAAVKSHQSEMATFRESLKKSEELLTRKLTELNEANVRTQKLKFKEFQSEMFVLSQQIKDAKTETVENANLIRPLTQRLTAVEDFVEQTRKSSLDVVAGKVQNLEREVAGFQAVESDHKKELDAAILQLQKQNREAEERTQEDIREMGAEVARMKQTIFDSPGVECTNGVADTEALVRAIQRDSRRLDNFNQIIMAIREDHTEIKSLFINLHSAVEKIQVNVMDFVKDANHTKAEVLTLCGETRTASAELRCKVVKCSSDIREVNDATMAGMNLIANTFLQVFSFLAKVTTRPLPVFASFDDALLELQRLSDGISSQNEKYDDEQRQREKSPVQELTLDPEWALPLVELQGHQLHQSRQEIALLMQAANDAAAPVSLSAGANLEVRQVIQDLEAKFQATVQEFKDFQEGYGGRINGKADFVLVERLTEKMKRMFTKVRDEQHEIDRRLFACVQRSEAESLIQHILLTTNAAGETAAGTARVECLLCGRGRSAVASSVLPALTGQAHDAVYGSGSPSRQFTRPNTRAGSAAGGSRAKSGVGLRPFSDQEMAVKPL